MTKATASTMKNDPEDPSDSGDDNDNNDANNPNYHNRKPTDDSNNHNLNNQPCKIDATSYTPHPPTNDNAYSRELANLYKMYINDNKYSGPNNEFDKCWKIFKYISLAISISKSKYKIAFSILLKNIMKDFYYN